MSEENDLVQSFEDWVEKSQDIMALMWLKNRIAELEKKLTWLSDENATLHTQVDDDALKRAENGQRIEKLESQNIGDNLDNMDTSIIRMKQELSELKKTIINNNISFDKEIKELKERLDNYNLKCWIPQGHRQTNIEEVLRELILTFQPSLTFSERCGIIFEKELLDKLGGDISVSVKGRETPLNQGIQQPVEPTAESQPPRHKDCMNCGNQSINYNKICQLCHDFNNWIPKENPSEQDAGSARQTDYIKSKSIYIAKHYYPCNVVNCPVKEASLAYEGNYYCIVHFIEMVQDDRCEKADLEFLFNWNPEFMSLDEIKRYNQLKEKYLPAEEDHD